LSEAPTDLPNGQAIATDPGKYLADEPGFIRDHFISRLSPARILCDIAVAIGRTAEDIHDSRPGGVPLAAPMPFDNFGPFILGDHPLHLQEEVIFRTLA
jgi:hypothetical protein